MNVFKKNTIPRSLFKEDNNKDQTTKTIALVLLWGFAISLGILFLTNIGNLYFLSHYKKTSDNQISEFEKSWLEFQKSWLELLKSNLIFLSSALTTVIGYYFGQKEGNAKSREADRIVKQTEKQAELVTGVIQDRDQAMRESTVKDSDSPDDDIPPALEDDNSIIIPR